MVYVVLIADTQQVQKAERERTETPSFHFISVDEKSIVQVETVLAIFLSLFKVFQIAKVQREDTEYHR